MSGLLERLSNVFDADKAAAKSSGRGKTNCVEGLHGLFNVKPSLVVRIAQTRARYSTPDSRFTAR